MAIRSDFKEVCDERSCRVLMDVPTVAVQGYLADGTTVFWNRASERFYGFTAEEAIGRPLTDLIIPPEMHDHARKGIREMVETGKAVPAGELMLMRKDGSRIPVYSSHTVIRMEGETPQLFCLDVDLTRCRQAEERLRTIVDCQLEFGHDTRANINRLVTICGQEMDAACALYNRLDEGMLCSIGQWHTPPGFQDRNKPAGHICNDVIRQGGEEAVVIRNLQQSDYRTTDPNVASYGLQTYVGVPVKSQGETVGSLCAVYQVDKPPTREQTDFIRLIGMAIGVEEERQEALDLNEAIAGMLQLLQSLVGCETELNWIPQDGLWLTYIDSGQVVQILTNLCVNARDAIGGGGGRVAITTANVVLDEPYCCTHEHCRAGDYIKLTVGDNGCGIPADVLAHVFEPFFTTKPAGKGTGLGLSTVYGIIKQNNGCITLSSRPGDGTVVDIYLPRHTGSLPTGDASDSAGGGAEPCR